MYVSMSGGTKVTNLDGLRNILNLANDLDNDPDGNEGSADVPNNRFNIQYNGNKNGKGSEEDDIPDPLDDPRIRVVPTKAAAKGVPKVATPTTKGKLLNQVKTQIEAAGIGADNPDDLVSGSEDPDASGEVTGDSQGSYEDDEEEVSGSGEYTQEDVTGSKELSEEVSRSRSGSRHGSRGGSRSVSVVGTPRRGSRSESRGERKRPMSAEEMMLEKQKIILEFSKLEKRGVTFTKKFTLNSDLNEMKFELLKSKKIYQLEKDLKIARNLLWNGTKVITFGANLLSKYTPIDLELEGWPDDIKSNIYDFDDVLEKLVEKYKSQVDAPPEMQLGYMLLSSAIQYSAANKVPKMFAKMMNVRGQEYDPNKGFDQQVNEMNVRAQQASPIGKGGGGGGVPEDDPEMADIMKEINAEKARFGK
jgi:hypothetical protein